MPRAPATRDQVDAYRFGLRRLEAALVRGDPVPLHEQIRSQRRAAFAGVLLGLLALGAVAVYALVVPRPDWTAQAVVVGKRSGGMYVVAHGPDRLVPVANLAAGRLVLAALARGGSATADPGAAVPVVIDDGDLDAAPRTATAAVPGAVAVRTDGTGIPARWAVCDEVTVEPDGRTRLAGTTVVAGAGEPPAGPAAPVLGGPADGVLLAVSGGATYLVTGGHRHRVDMADRALLATFGLAGRVPRPAAAALVSAVAEGPPLVTPDIPGTGEPAPGGLPGRVGDVVVATLVGGSPRYYVVLRTGLQEVPPAMAELLGVATGGGEPREIGPEVAARATLVDELSVTGWPVGAPRLLEPVDSPVVCWTWSAEAETGGVLIGAAAPVPADAVTVTLAQADGSGEQVDAVVMAPGGGPVQATGPGQAPGTGALWLVSATGVAYGVPDGGSAAALGIRRADPAPEAALRLLPTGPTLDLSRAARAVDVLDPQPGGGSR